jgi:hypothetical protein
MSVRNATLQDLDVLEEIYESAKHFMHTHGNPNQWNNGHPNRDDFISDIAAETLYVIEEDGQIQASFKFYIGLDPTYGYIEGNWLNDESYGVIHRVATRGLKKGMGQKIIDTCKSWYPNLKIDTHKDNIYMQRLLHRCGFLHTGIIYLENGDPRLAFQFVEKAQPFK